MASLSAVSPWSRPLDSASPGSETLGRAPLRVRSGDLRWRISQEGTPRAVVLLADNSYSVHSERVAELVKGVVAEVLRVSHQQRDRVGIVAFVGGRPLAKTAVPISRNIRLSRQKLEQLPLSGTTSLADGIRRSLILLRQETRRYPGTAPVLVIVYDMEATAALRPGNDPVRDAHQQARAVAAAGVHLVVIDTSSHGRGAHMAEAGGGTWLTFEPTAPPQDT